MLAITFQKTTHFVQSIHLLKRIKRNYSFVDVVKLNKPRSDIHVVVGLSGGVDSSVSAYLLKKAGFKVTGLFMHNWSDEERGNCTSKEDFEDAKKICETLQIPIRRVNFVGEYWNNVFTEFINGIKSGITPNPDVLCNKEIKFKRMFEYAMKLGADYLATGHYAQTGWFIDEDGKENAKLLKAFDEVKDQTYFLSAINSKVLEKVLFPVGHLVKPEVRNIASSIGLVTADKKDSVGICFIGKKNFQDFLCEHFVVNSHLLKAEFIEERPGGTFVNAHGKTIASKHNGAHLFTIGQRAKVSGLSEAVFVYDKDIKNNIVYVCPSNHPALFCDELETEQVSWISGKPPIKLMNGEINLDCKTRSFQQPFACSISLFDDSRLKVSFKTPTKAIAKGQHVVFYDGKECLGGAMIRAPGPSYHQMNKPLPSEFKQTNIIELELWKTMSGIREKHVSYMNNKGLS